ncbi:hypothetical protein DI09_7p230 [Mitosporidium daphniae]|uniref:Uncharacterized protein n=1 Tax=Mitosporidium daphniae TaxID=1485682 RepID=A0A098VN63_9MICR|nr:uncharacterized protein DI09_7p230 [Mitosporidium daphniae]KGG50244.1 hypothetical protein DI09_7p230 [Mitosporidium daphniae]|eukprot:XP_013236671.1 uncharacterized protein DI09_7p230 [Mitosporidium daphniae]
MQSARKTATLATDLWVETAKFEFCFPEALASDLSQNIAISSLQKSAQSLTPYAGKDDRRKARSPGARHSENPVSTAASASAAGSSASIFAIPVFPLPQRDPKKLYVIALDLARELGMRDSYTLFHRNVETLTKLWASEDEKNWLSSLGLIASNIRHRDISLVEVGQAIKKYAVNLAKPGISISRLEHFIENPVISDILTVAEFEGMKSYGLVPEGFSPSFDSEHPKDIHIPVFDTPPNKRTKIATATSSDSLAEHFSDPACSQLLTRAIAEASDYNRWLVIGEFENVQRVKLSENDSPHYEIECRHGADGICKSTSALLCQM